MNSQEQIFYEFGLLHARLLRNRTELTLAKRIASDFADRLRPFADSFDMEKAGNRVADCQFTADMLAGASSESASFSLPANPEKIGEILSLLEKLEEEERELEGNVKIREDLLLDLEIVILD